VVLAPGDKVAVGDYSIEYMGARSLTKADRTEFFNDLLVSRPNGDTLAMTAWRAFYPDQRMTSTRAAIHSTPVEDLYIVSSESTDNGNAVFRIMVNPMVWWMWLAGPLLILGTAIALWPKRQALPLPSPEDTRVMASPVGKE